MLVVLEHLVLGPLYTLKLESHREHLFLWVVSIISYCIRD